MAQAFAYRAAYTVGTDEYERVYFSEWVSADGIGDMEDMIAELVDYDEQGNPVGSSPTIVGWEKKELDTEPI